MRLVILLLLLLLSPLLVMAENQAVPISILVIPLVDPPAYPQPIYQKKDVPKEDKLPFIRMAFEAKLYRMLLREYAGAAGSLPIPI
ncbi:MAG: hypothetical protein C0200_07865 [Thermoproteota archaeon]|nr:MAG: hypothetical protein C0200_07865 [Candidatus Korarchaeota archaeon]